MTYVQVEFVESGRPVYALAEAVRVLTEGVLKVGLSVSLTGYQGNYLYTVISHQTLPNCDTVWICVPCGEAPKPNLKLNFKPDYGWTLSEISLCAVETPR